jgi:hypothetical protein
MGAALQQRSSRAFCPGSGVTRSQPLAPARLKLRL